MSTSFRSSLALLIHTQRDDDETETGPSAQPAEVPVDSAAVSALPKDDLQTFVFSATLSKDLQRNLKRHSKPKGKKNRKPASTLGVLFPTTMALIDLSSCFQTIYSSVSTSATLNQRSST